LDDTVTEVKIAIGSINTSHGILLLCNIEHLTEREPANRLAAQVQHSSVSHHHSSSHRCEDSSSVIHIAWKHFQLSPYHLIFTGLAAWT
jgi:hypothetical protein